MSAKNVERLFAMIRSGTGVAIVYSGLVGLSIVAQRRYVHGHCFDPRKWDRWEDYFKVGIE